MTTPLVLLDKEGPVAVVTLNRPERHNSLVPPLLQQLLEALQAVQTDPDVRVLLLRANGRSFSTGGDMRGFYEHLDRLEAYAAELVGLLNRAILALFDLPVPVVAAVHGIVTGGSLGLVLASDVLLLSPQASFTPYYSVVGFSPDGGWTALLPQVIGARRAAKALLCNQTITPDQAVAWGLASRIVPAVVLQETALATARDIAAKKSGSLRHTRCLLYPHDDIAGRLEAERARFVQQVATAEARQGIVTFMERPH